MTSGGTIPNQKTYTVQCNICKNFVQSTEPIRKGEEIICGDCFEIKRRNPMKQFWLDTTKITDEELADLIHELSNELDTRLRKHTGFKGQLEAARITIRSWSTNKQNSFAEQIRK